MKIRLAKKIMACDFRKVVRRDLPWDKELKELDILCKKSHYWYLRHYAYKPLKMIFNLSVQKFLANDLSVRGEVTRYFKNSAVGFYVQSMAIPDYPVNGGFFFAFSLPPYKHNRNKFVRVTSGDYFSLEYIARPYGQYGRYFTTSPDENSSYNFFNKIHLSQIFEN